MQKHEPIVEGTHSLFGLQHLKKTLKKTFEKHLTKNTWQKHKPQKLVWSRTQICSKLFLKEKQLPTIKKLISFFISKSNKLFKIIGLIVKSFVTDPQ